MIADSMVCSNVGIYCRDENELISFTVQGAGELFTIEGTCGDAMAG
jgi:hypothetical protein